MEHILFPENVCDSKTIVAKMIEMLLHFFFLYSKSVVYFILSKRLNNHIGLMATILDSTVKASVCIENY